jgi:hypothetical protein
MNSKEKIKTQSTSSKSSFNIKKIINNSYFAVFCLAILVIIIFSSFLFSNKMLFGSDTMGGLDQRVFLKESILKYKQIPMWFSCRLSGMPSIDAIFADVFYLPTLVITTIMPIYRALGIRLVLHVFLAGLFFFLLLRKGFKMPIFVSFIGGAFYMLNCEFFSHVYPGHDGKMFVIAWLPFVIWQMKSLVDKTNFLNSSLLAFGIGICLLTSHIQMTYFMLWGIFFYLIIALILIVRKEKNYVRAIKLFAFFCISVLIGIGISLIQFLPSYLYVQHAFSVRGVDRGFDYAASWSLHWPEVFSLWVPEFGNYLENYWSENPFKLNTEYAGAIATLFGIIAVFQKPNIWRIFWACVGVFSVLYSLGAHSFVFHLAYNIIPGVKKFRACSMFMFWFSFSTILLASLFLKDIINGWFLNLDEKRKQKWTKGLLIAIGVLTVLTFLFSIKSFVLGLMQNLTESLSDFQKQRIFENNFTNNFLPFLWLWYLFAISLLLLLLGIIKKKVSTKAFLIAVCAIGLFDLIRIDSKFVKTIDPRPYFLPEKTITELKSEMSIEPFRCFSFPQALPEGGEGLWSLEGVGGFHDNELRWYREYRGDQQNKNYYTNLLGFTQDGRPYLKPENLSLGNAFLNIANVKYYLIRQNGMLYKIPNNGALGRLSFCSKYIIIDSTQIINALLQEKYNYKTTIALFNEPKEKDIVNNNIISDSINFNTTWIKYSPNYRKAKVYVNRNGFLRISEVYYPGWEVKIDSKKVPIYRADLCWMAVYLEKGEHEIEMIPHSLYLSKAEIVSYPLMILLLIYWMGVLAYKILKRNRN